MARYRLTESRLRGMIREAIKSALTEVTHGYVANAMNNMENPENNPKNKTPEQIQAQQDRITKLFNQRYGGNGIQYDFNKNAQIAPGKAWPEQWGQAVSRNEYSTVGRGGVTINGQRYTPGEVNQRYLDRDAWNNTENSGWTPERLNDPYYVNKYNNNDLWAWYGSSYRHTPSVFDQNGQTVNTNQFTPDQINALNNVNNTYKRTANRDWYNNIYYTTKRGGTPFKPNVQ